MIMACRHGLHALGRPSQLNPGIQSPQLPATIHIHDRALDQGPGRAGNRSPSLSLLLPPDLEDFQARKLDLTLEAKRLRQLGTSCSSRVTTSTCAKPHLGGQSKGLCFILLWFKAHRFLISFLPLPPLLHQSCSKVRPKSTFEENKKHTPKKKKVRGSQYCISNYTTKPL